MHMQQELSKGNCLLESRNKVVELCSALEKGGRKVSNECAAFRKANRITLGKSQ